MGNKNTEIDIVRGEVDAKKKTETFIWLSDWHEDGQSDNDLLRGLRALAYIGKHPDWRVFLGGDQLDCAQVSNQPNHKPKSIEDNLENFEKHFKPLYPQIDGMVQGNHESRMFRVWLGSGLLPDLVTGHHSMASDIQEKNPNLIFADIDRGIHLDIETCDDTLHWLMAHGRKCGLSADSEFQDQLKVYRNLDASFLGHTHSPTYKPEAQITPEGNIAKFCAVRGSAFTSFPPYQEARNLPPCRLGFWKVTLRNGRMLQPEFVDV